MGHAHLQNLDVQDPLTCRFSAVYLTMPMYLGSVLLFGLLGLVMFTYYHDCDPLQTQRITSPNQVRAWTTARTPSYTSHT